MVYPFQLLEYLFYHNALGVADRSWWKGEESEAAGYVVDGGGGGGCCWRKFIGIETVISFLMKNDIIRYPNGSCMYYFLSLHWAFAETLFMIQYLGLC